jgi:hypothetical protein
MNRCWPDMKLLIVEMQETTDDDSLFIASYDALWSYEMELAIFAVVLVLGLLLLTVSDLPRGTRAVSVTERRRRSQFERH